MPVASPTSAPGRTRCRTRTACGRSPAAAVSGTPAATGPSQGVAGDGVRVLVLDDSTSDAEPTAGNRPNEGGGFGGACHVRGSDRPVGRTPSVRA